MENDTNLAKHDINSGQKTHFRPLPNFGFFRLSKNCLVPNSPLQLCSPYQKLLQNLFWRSRHQSSIPSSFSQSLKRVELQRELVRQGRTKSDKNEVSPCGKIMDPSRAVKFKKLINFDEVREFDFGGRGKESLRHWLKRIFGELSVILRG